MTIIFDLDYTLLDTAQFKDDLSASLCECGISSDLFLATYASSSYREDQVDYDSAKHVKALKEHMSCSEEDALARIDKVLSNMRKYLFPGAEDVLQKLRKKKHHLVLFTHGNVSWQRKKVGHLFLEAWFDELLFTPEEKIASFESLGAFKKPVVMVNDNGKEIDALKNLFPEYVMIAIRSSKPLPIRKDVLICDTLDEVLDVIENV